MAGMMDDGFQGLDDSDEFDPAALLSQPLFNDSQGDLNINPNDLVDEADAMMSNDSAGNSIPNQQNQAMLMEQQRQQLQAFHQQQQQHGAFHQQSQQVPPQNQFGNFSDQSPQQQVQMQNQNQNQFGGFNQADSQQGNSSFNMGDVQVQQNFQQLQQFQNQQQMNNSQSMIQQQMNSSQSMMQQQQQPNQQMDGMQQMPQQQQQPFQNQQGFQNMQGGMNSNARSSRGAEFTRAPPGRSVSMPIQRMYGSSSMGNNNDLMMMQQQQRMQAMAQNGGIYQQQQQQPDMDTSHNSHTSMQVNANMGGRQQQNMEGSFSSLAPPMMPQRNSLPLPPETGSMQGSSPMMQSPKMVANKLQANAANFMSPQQQGSADGEGPPTVNEAMEKLCESMRRSAMSRSLVKRLSGRSAPQRGNLAASNSARMRQLVGGNTVTGRSIGRANSGRAVQRSHSGRAGMDNAPNLPVRRINHDSKHRMGGRPEPSRGVFRHKSQPIGFGRSPFPNNPQEFNPNQNFNPNGPGGG